MGDDTTANRHPSPVSWGCSLCMARRVAGDDWLLDLCPEEVFSPSVVVGIRRSLGLCPAHTRTLLTARLSRIGLAQFVEGLLRRAADRGGRGPREVERCPACQHADRAAEHLVGEVAMRPGALCLPHLLAVLPRAEKSTRLDLLERTTRRLDGSRDPGQVLGFLAGDDPDARLRGQLRRGRSYSPAPGGYLGERLVEDLPRALCPICSAGDAAVVRYLSWLARSDESDLNAGDADVCPQHAGDLARLDPTIVPRAASSVLRERWSAWLDHLHRLLSNQRSLGESAFVPFGLNDCRGCRARQEAEQQTEQLLGVMLADSSGRVLPLLGYGPCHRHVIQWSDRPTRRLVVDLHRGRLRVACAEIRSEQRRLTWAYRYDTGWPARSMALSALALVDGRIFLGGEPSSDMAAALQAPAVLGRG